MPSGLGCQGLGVVTGRIGAKVFSEADLCLYLPRCSSGSPTSLLASRKGHIGKYGPRSPSESTLGPILPGTTASSPKSRGGGFRVLHVLKRIIDMPAKRLRVLPKAGVAILPPSRHDLRGRRESCSGGALHAKAYQRGWEYGQAAWVGI